VDGETFSSYVRPVLTVSFTGAFIYGFLAGMIGADVFTGVATMVIIYWFKSRDEAKTGEQVIAAVKEAKKE
jgi:hypothetical protein